MQSITALIARIFKFPYDCSDAIRLRASSRSPSEYPIMKKLITVSIFAALVAGFCGLMTAALLPLPFPGVLALTSPITCPGGGTALAVREEFSDRQGTGFTQHIECMEGDRVLAQGNNLEVPTIAIAACIPLFLVLVPIFMMFGKVEPENPASPDYEGETLTSISRSAIRGANLNASLAELKEAYEAGNLTEDEYQDKRKELIDGL
jgi:hypothetical protein